MPAWTIWRCPLRFSISATHITFAAFHASIRACHTSDLITASFSAFSLTGGSNPINSCRGYTSRSFLNISCFFSSQSTPVEKFCFSFRRHSSVFLPLYCLVHSGPRSSATKILACTLLPRVQLLSFSRYSQKTPFNLFSLFFFPVKSAALLQLSHRERPSDPNSLNILSFIKRLLVLDISDSDCLECEH